MRAARKGKIGDMRVNVPAYYSYANDHVHTNGLENFWSLLKRTIKGTYVHCEAFHLFRYLDERAYRFNERELADAGRFIGAMSGISNRRLTYEHLTGKTA